MRAAATASGVVALASLPAAVLLTSDVAKTAVYATAFVAAFAAIVLAAVAHLRTRDEHPTVAPRTRTGRWSVGLTTAGIALLLLAPVLATVLHGNGTEPVLVVAAPGLLGVGAMIAAAVTALVAWFRRGERSVLVLLGVVPGLLALSLLIGEFVFLH